MPSPLAGGLAGLVRLLERAGFAVAHCVVTYTPSMARELGLDPDSPRVFPNGARYVETDRFAIQTPYEDRGTVVGFLGRLDEEKQIRTLAKVARSLPEEVEFRFVGDGDLRAWLETELAVEIDRGTVTVTGWIDHDEVPAELNRLKLLVLPSQPTEGLPTTILEALACGTPVLATPVSGVPDVVREGDTGFHIRSTDPTDIEDRVRGILGREDLGAVSRRGREAIEKEYSFEAATARYRTLLETIQRGPV